MIGRTCQACRPDYFNFTSGRGCKGEIVVIENSHTRFSLNCHRKIFNGEYTYRHHSLICRD